MHSGPTALPIRVIILMGVAGTGKSAVGAALAAKLGGEFYDADDYHPASNIEMMKSGRPLGDAERAPWLERLRREVVDATPYGSLAVLACSALKKKYRDRLGVDTDGVALVHLHTAPDVLLERLVQRPNHFMKEEMLASQLADLEPPCCDEGITVENDRSLDLVVDSIVSRLS